DDLLDEFGCDLRAVVEGHVVVQPLPDLGTGDLGGRGVLHEVVDRHGAVTAHPGRQVLQGDVDVAAQACLGDPAGGLVHGEQVRRRDVDVGALLVDLVGLVPQHAVEDLAADRDQVGVGDPGAVETVTG